MTEKSKSPIAGVKNTDRGLVKPDESQPYHEMDALDERAIVAAYTGQSFESMVYDIPFKDGKGNAPKTCHKANCPYKGKSHTHVTGVGIQGINELVQLMGGIVVEIIDCKPIKKNGKGWWWAKAVARDQFTMTERYGEGECPAIMRRGGDDMRGDFPKLIAQSKAERNAVKKILPQAVLAGIANLALEGKSRFTEEDVATLFKPFWTTRSALKSQWMNALIQNRLEGGAAPKMVSPTSHLSPAPSKPEDAPADSPGEPGGPTPKMFGYMVGLLVNSGEGFTKDTAKAFINENATTFDLASDYISAFKGGNFKDAIDWLDKQTESEAGNEQF